MEAMFLKCYACKAQIPKDTLTCPSCNRSIFTGKQMPKWLKNTIHYSLAVIGMVCAVLGFFVMFVFSAIGIVIGYHLKERAVGPIGPIVLVSNILLLIVGFLLTLLLQYDLF